ERPGEPGIGHLARAAQPRPRAQADPQDRRDDRAHRQGRLRLLREVRYRDRPEAPRGPSYRDAVHRLQDDRRAAREAEREVAKQKGRRSALPFDAGIPRQCCVAAASAFTAFIERRTRPFSSASSTLTFTCWPSLR